MDLIDHLRAMATEQGHFHDSDLKHAKKVVRTPRAQAGALTCAPARPLEYTSASER